MVLSGESDDAALQPVVLEAAQLMEPDVPAGDHSLLIDGHLFGEPDAEPAASAAIVPAQAPETTLDLVLKATIADVADDRRGVAIIANESMERTYFVADPIDGADGALLHSIHGDRVVLDRGGRLETLWLAPVHAVDRAGRAMPSPLARLVPALPPTPEAASLQDAILGFELADMATGITTVRP